MLHTTQSVTDHSRTTFPIIHCTNTAVCTDHAHTCKQSPNHHHPITHTHTHYISPGHSPIHCRVLLASLPTKRFSLVSLVCFPVFRFRPCPWIILSALPTGLSLPIADPRLPKDYSSVLSMPYPFAPARPCLY